MDTLAAAAEQLFERELGPQAVLADMSLPDGNSLDLLQRVRTEGMACEWILLTGYGSIPDSVRALQLGALDFLEKPCPMERLDLVVNGALRSAGAQQRLTSQRRRSRIEDLEQLVPQFVAEYNQKANRRVRQIPEALWQRLRGYRWPGNVRELRNVIERCVLLSDGEVFPEQWLQLPGGAPAESAEVDGESVRIPMDGSMALEEMEAFIIRTALERHDFNVTATARALGTTRETLRYRTRKYGLRSAD